MNENKKRNQPNFFYLPRGKYKVHTMLAQGHSSDRYTVVTISVAAVTLITNLPSKPIFHGFPVGATTVKSLNNWESMMRKSNTLFSPIQ
jgi:hypothetical protein